MPSVGVTAGRPSPPKPGPPFRGHEPDRIEENTLVNRIRERVALWRESGYPDATRTTARLLDYWRDPERENPSSSARSRRSKPPSTSPGSVAHRGPTVRVSLIEDLPSLLPLGRPNEATGGASGRFAFCSRRVRALDRALVAEGDRGRETLFHTPPLKSSTGRSRIYYGL
jgi:hypothetical protein